jgi:hypothetical protein
LELEQIILCALEKDPDARFDTTDAFREALVSSGLASTEPPEAVPFTPPRSSEMPRTPATSQRVKPRCDAETTRIIGRAEDFAEASTVDRCGLAEQSTTVVDATVVDRAPFRGVELWRQHRGSSLAIAFAVALALGINFLFLGRADQSEGVTNTAPLSTSPAISEFAATQHSSADSLPDLGGLVSELAILSAEEIESLLPATALPTAPRPIAQHAQPVPQTQAPAAVAAQRQTKNNQGPSTPAAGGDGWIIERK